MKHKVIIKTEYIVDDSGKNFDDGRVKKDTMFLVPLSLKEALDRLDANKRIYFIYPNFLDGKSGRKVCRSKFYAQNHYGLYQDICGERAPLNKLTDAECNVLNTLAARSKMDCWFCLEEKDGKDYVRDLEKNQTLRLKEAIPLFYEGLTNLADYDLCPLEIRIANDLFERFGISRGKE